MRCITDCQNPPRVYVLNTNGGQKMRRYSTNTIRPATTLGKRQDRILMERSCIGCGIPAFFRQKKKAPAIARAFFFLLVAV
jgi:hypothetical protein